MFLFVRFCFLFFLSEKCISDMLNIIDLGYKDGSAGDVSGLFPIRSNSMWEFQVEIGIFWGKKQPNKKPQPLATGTSRMSEEIK